MKLTGRVIKTTDITNDNIEQMLRLMQENYDNVSMEGFLRDLSEKDRVILLEDAEGIKGFSTQMQFDHTIDRKTVTVVFSGDTIIDRSCWGTLALPLTFGRMMFDIKARSEDKVLYWFLISKGYRTYRFLSTFFKVYYPNNNDLEGKFEQQLLAEVAQVKFGDSFDRKAGVIRANPDSQKLKSGICDISQERRKNRHIAFFEELNPGYPNGDELACIAEFDRSNITPFILKRLADKSAIGVSK